MDNYKYKINGTDYDVTIDSIQGQTAQVTVNGQSYTVELPAEAAAPVVAQPAAPAACTPSPAAAPAPCPTPAAGGGSVLAPLPGVVMSINKKVGDTVQPSDVLLVLEAMKMENAIPCGRAGRITSIAVSQGDSVLEGAVLATIA